MKNAILFDDTLYVFAPADVRVARTLHGRAMIAMDVSYRDFLRLWAQLHSTRCDPIRVQGYTIRQWRMCHDVGHALRRIAAI